MQPSTLAMTQGSWAPGPHSPPDSVTPGRVSSNLGEQRGTSTPILYTPLSCLQICYPCQAYSQTKTLFFCCTQHLTTTTSLLPSPCPFYTPFINLGSAPSQVGIFLYYGVDSQSMLRPRQGAFPAPKGTPRYLSKS